jgi:drug/metabolite transporter (DMT)-like permease
VRVADLTRLVALAAIWGASFLFMRVAVGSLGAMAMAESRLVLAGATIAIYLAIAGKRLDLARHWRHYAIVGTLNSAAPFALYAWSAQHLPASYLAVINATAPLFGAFVASLWLGDRITPRTALGLTAGVAGVATLVGLGPIAATPAAIAAALAGLVASLFYAVASAYVKRRSYAVDSSALAGGSNIAAAVVLLALAVAAPPPGLPAPDAIRAAVALGVLCTGVAYLLYFRLIADVGPARALTVTFLIPVFGMLWGAVFLGETITATMLAGCALVLAGTGLTLSWPAGSTPVSAQDGDARIERSAR